MGRPKGSKNAEEKNSVIVSESGKEIEVSNSSDNMVLIKTSNRDIVSKANVMKYNVVHISGYGTPHNPKIFFILVDELEFKKKLTPEEIDEVEPAIEDEIKGRIADSIQRQKKEYAESNARRRKLNQEIVPSEVYN